MFDGFDFGDKTLIYNVKLVKFPILICILMLPMITHIY